MLTKERKKQLDTDLWIIAGVSLAGNGAHGQGVSPEKVSCSALGDRHGTWSRSLLAVRPDCGGAGIEKKQGFLFVG